MNKTKIKIKILNYFFYLKKKDSKSKYYSLR